jgi:hypothetical protein
VLGDFTPDVSETKAPKPDYHPVRPGRLTDLDDTTSRAIKRGYQRFFIDLMPDFTKYRPCTGMVYEFLSVALTNAKIC